MRKRSIWLLLSLLALLPVVRGQHLGFLAGGGWCLPNDQTFSYVSQPTGSAAILMEWPQADGWLLGVRADAMAMRHAIAGTRFSLSVNIEDRLFGPIDEVLELGLSAYTNPFRSSGDTLNALIGTVLNCHIGVGLRLRIPVDESHSLSFSTRLVHSSNGYLRKPNRGLNYLQAELGVHFAPVIRHTPIETAFQPMPVFRCFASYAPGVVQERGPVLDAPYYYAHSLLLGALHPLSRNRLLGAEVDFMYNYAHRAEARRNGDENPLPLYVGLCATYQRDWDRLFMRVSLGSDVVRSSYLLGYVYERIGLNYRLNSGHSVTPYVGAACKAYYAHIDYIEWTFGVEF